MVYYSLLGLDTMVAQPDEVYLKLFFVSRDILGSICR